MAPKNFVKQPIRNLKVNRRHKDILFSLIFSEKKELLQLYNALNGSSYDNPDDLIINTLEDVVYMGIKNDVSFIVDRTLNLYEHQSSINPNMPLRGLLYISEIYHTYLKLQGGNIYGSKLFQLPVPQYIIFYNGSKELPDQDELKLSDAFQPTVGNAKPCLEFTARVININRGHNEELLDKCRKLNEYSLFVAKTRYYEKQGYSIRRALENAIDDCIEQGILRDILLKNKAEVMRVYALTHFDEKKHIASEKKIAREEGLEEGRKQGLEEGLKEGLKEGTTRVNKLNQYLIKTGKLDELKRSTIDRDYQEELFIKYHIGQD